MPGPHRPYETKDVTLAAGHRLRYYEWPGEAEPDSAARLVRLRPDVRVDRHFLGNRFHIFAPDQRGHGDSDKPDGTYSAQEYAEDLHQFVGALGLGSAVVGGHSLGGRVSQVFAATHPEESQGVILVGGLHLSNFYQDRARVARACAARVAQSSPLLPRQRRWRSCGRPPPSRTWRQLSKSSTPSKTTPSRITTSRSRTTSRT